MRKERPRWRQASPENPNKLNLSKYGGYFRRRRAEFKVAAVEHRSVDDRCAIRLELERRLANLICVFVSVVLPCALLIFKTIMTETPPETPQQPYTFVRIKRKRTDAPLDALRACLIPYSPFKKLIRPEISVFGSDLSEPSRKKKLRPGVNVFQFASTVEEASWDDSTQKDLQVRWNIF